MNANAPSSYPIQRALRRGVFSLACLATLVVPLHAQSVADLQSTYTGTENWNAATGTLTFTGSGAFAFKKSNSTGVIWAVPAEVKEIVINANVQVTGSFTISKACTVRGMNRDTSKIFGTNEQEWSKSRGLDGALFSAIKVDDAVVTVKNLSMYRPFAYFIRGNSGSKITVDQVTLRDDRGGVKNNSDGFVGGDGSSVSNPLFATGDNAVKVYYGNTTYNSLTIEMEPNCVPVQIGWFAHGNVSATFNDLKVTGKSGRGSSTRFPVISGAGNYKTTATLTFNRPYIDNPNASIFSLEGTSMTVNGSMSNAYVKVARYNDSRHVGKVGLTICGSTTKTYSYDCRSTDTIPKAPSGLKATAASKSQINLTWADNSSNETKFELQRSANGSSGWTLISSPDANVKSASSTGLTAKTKYYYRVRAINGAGNSAFSSTASATTAAK